MPTPTAWGPRARSLVDVRAGSSPADFSADVRAPILVADGRGQAAAARLTNSSQHFSKEEQTVLIITRRAGERIMVGDHVVVEGDVRALPRGSAYPPTRRDSWPRGPTRPEPSGPRRLGPGPGAKLSCAPLARAPPRRDRWTHDEHPHRHRDHPAAGMEEVSSSMNVSWSTGSGRRVISVTVGVLIVCSTIAPRRRPRERRAAQLRAGTGAQPSWAGGFRPGGTPGPRVPPRRRRSRPARGRGRRAS